VQQRLPLHHAEYRGGGRPGSCGSADQGAAPRYAFLAHRERCACRVEIRYRSTLPAAPRLSERPESAQSGSSFGTWLLPVLPLSSHPAQRRSVGRKRTSPCSPAASSIPIGTGDSLSDKLISGMAQNARTKISARCRQLRAVEVAGGRARKRDRRRTVRNLSSTTFDWSGNEGFDRSPLFASLRLRLLTLVVSFSKLAGK